MITERVAPPAINQNGWVYYDKCRCHGKLKYKYRNPALPGLELEWQPKNYLFMIRNGASTKVPLTKVSEMEKVLQNLSA